MSEKKKKKKRLTKRPAVGNIRDSINAQVLIEALERHVLGKSKMTSTQVSAALALLKKTLPDLSEPVRKLLQGAEQPKAHEAALRDLE